jgi:hypothetical protein
VQRFVGFIDINFNDGYTIPFGLLHLKDSQAFYMVHTKLQKNRLELVFQIVGIKGTIHDCFFKG